MKYIINLTLIGLLLLMVSCGGSDAKDEVIVDKNTSDIPVKVESVQAGSFHHYIEVSGNVEAVEYAFISSETPGQIKEILVSEGDNVSKGQVLVKLNSSAIDGQIQQVQSQLNLAIVTYQKQDELWNKKHVGSEIQYLQAKTQKEALEGQLNTLESQKAMSIIKAPFSGIVDNISLKEGELASPGMRLLELVNLNKMKIKSDISEHLLPVIHKNDSVIITFPTYKNIEIKAPIYRTGNVINPANRTFTIEIRVNNIGKKLKPNMISNLKIMDYSLKNAITVPSIIVKKDFDKEFVFVIEKTDSNTVAKKVFVETGRSYKDRTLILKGLNINQNIIVQGYNTVSTGVAVKIIDNI